MKLLASVILLSMSYASQAFACRPAPLDWRLDFKNDVAARVMTNFDVDIANVSKVILSDLKVLEYKWVQADPRIDCHDYEKLSATVRIEYIAKTGNSCVSEATAIKAEGRYDNAPKATYEIVDPQTQCLE